MCVMGVTLAKICSYLPGSVPAPGVDRCEDRARMRILAFSDLHRDLDQAARLVEKSGNFDVVIGAGDFASQHSGLEETIAALRPIAAPTVLVPGNNETGE